MQRKKSIARPRATSKKNARPVASPAVTSAHIAMFIASLADLAQRRARLIELGATEADTAKLDEFFATLLSFNDGRDGAIELRNEWRAALRFECRERLASAIKEAFAFVDDFDVDDEDRRVSSVETCVAVTVMRCAAVLELDVSQMMAVVLEELPNAKFHGGPAKTASIIIARTSGVHVRTIERGAHPSPSLARAVDLAFDGAPLIGETRPSDLLEVTIRTARAFRLAAGLATHSQLATEVASARSDVENSAFTIEPNSPGRVTK